MNQYRTIIFDLDGTLIHSAPDLQAAANAALDALGRQPLDLATVVSFIGNGVEALVERSLHATGGMSQPAFSAALARFREYYGANSTTLTRPYPGVEDCLAALAARGCRLGICTNKPEDFARSICRGLGIEPLFGVIAGAVPGERKKPDPAPLRRAMAALESAAADCLYVGDSAVDYRTARNAGVAFRLFTGGYLNGRLPEVAERDRFAVWAEAGLV